METSARTAEVSFIIIIKKITGTTFSESDRFHIHGITFSLLIINVFSVL